MTTGQAWVLAVGAAVAAVGVVYGLMPFEAQLSAFADHTVTCSGAFLVDASVNESGLRSACGSGAVARRPLAVGLFVIGAVVAVVGHSVVGVSEESPTGAV